MRRLPLLATFLAMAACLSTAQDIPKGVRYKKAPEEVNKRAFSKLQKLFASTPERADFSKLSSEIVICGPTLWAGIKKAAPPALKNSKPVTMVVGRQELEAKGVQTEKAKEYLWISVMLVAKAPAKPVIRKATAEELRYYWAIIAWDIEEPLYVADLRNGKKFLFQFDEDKQDPKIFFVDLVGTFASKE